jgi:hypothetical protein
MQTYRLLASFALSALVLCGETDYRFAFPQSEILLGIDVKWLMKSPVGETMKKEMKANLGELKPLEALLDQIDTVHLSVVSKQKQNSDLLMLVQGRFDADKLIELAARNGLRMEQWGKIKVLLPTKSKVVPTKKATLQKAQFGVDVANTKPTFALFDNKNIVIGEEAPLRVALERLETGLTPQANPLFERARDLEAANDVWLVGNTAPLNLAPAAGKPTDPMSQLAAQVRNFSVGIAVRRNVNLDLQLQTTSPKAATQMLDLMKGAVAMAKMTPTTNDQPFPVDLDKVLQFSATGNLVKASIAMEQSDIDKIMASGMVPGTTMTKSDKQAPLVSSAAPVTPPVVVAVKPAEPVRKTVMIYGLPGGPKEVPVN